MIPGSSGGDPIDNYLNRLSQIKANVDKNMPGLMAANDAILSASTKNMIPNGIPMNTQGAFSNQIPTNMGTFTPRQNPGVGNSQEYAKSLIANTISTPVNQDQAPKQIAFGAGIDQYNFDRYYNHPQYNKLGWQPYGDNETFYNQNSTWTDDFSRASSQWLSLAGLGLKQTFGNWDDLFTLNTEGDTKHAREMNRMMSIANSTRGGLGGFATNLYANSAYTFGVMTEIVLEEAALWAATALTEGALGGLAATKTFSNLKRLFEIPDTLEDVAQVTRTVDDVVDTGTAFNAVDNVSNARKFWNGVGNFINPFENTAQAFKNLKTGENGFDELTRFARGKKTFGAFFGDLQLLNTGLAESRLEGGMVENEVFNKTYNEFIEKNGYAPSGNDLNEIMANAKKAGIRTTMANFPAIVYSNKIVFDKLLNKFIPFRGNGAGSLGEAVFNFGKKGGGKLEGFIDPNNAKSWFTKKYWRNVGNQFRPENMGKNTMRYFAANLSEGLQESYQETMAKAITEYYLDTYADPDRAGTANFLSKLSDSFGEQFTGQGAETFLSGFLMGGLVQGPQTLATSGINAIRDANAKRKDPKGYAERVARREKDRQDITTFINDLGADPKKFFDAMYANFKAQKDFSNLMNEAEANGDQKAHGDAQSDSLFSHVKTLLNRGYYDLFTQQIDKYAQLNDDELNQAFGYSADNGSADEFNRDMRTRLTEIKEKAEHIKARHDKYSTIKNPFRLNTDDLEEMMDHIGFESVRDLAIYSEYSYDQVASRMGDILNQAAADKTMSQVKMGGITNIFSPTQLEQELKNLKEEMTAYAEGTPEQQKMGAQKKAQFEALTNLRAAIETYSRKMQQAKKAGKKDAETTTELKDDVKLNRQIKEGSLVEITVGKTKVPGKVIKRSPTQVTVEYTNAKGEKKTKKFSISSKSISLVGGTQLEIDFDQENPIESVMDYASKQLREDFAAYIKSLAAEGKMPLDTTIEKMFNLFQDYLHLNADSGEFAKAVNLLNDPAYFSMAARKFSEGAKVAHANAVRKLEESYQEFKNKMDTNELLKKLFMKFNVFFPPSEIQALEKGERVPSVFFDAGTKKPLDPSNPRYMEIVDFLEEELGTTLEGKEIPEESPFDARPYEYKSKNDDRTAKKIMRDLGLDPNVKTHTVSVKELLQYLISSRKGRVESRKLAQRLLAKMKDSDTVTISLAEPVPFSYTKEKGIVIDPRYVSSDFGNAPISLDYAVLNPLIQKFVAENLEDTEFSKSIDNLMDAVREYYEQNKDTIKNESVKAMYEFMLSSKERFISEAITSSQGQVLLEGISYKNTTESLWKDFIEAIRKLLAKFIGVKREGDSALTEAIGIVSNKYEGTGPSFKGSGVEETSKTEMTAISPEMPVNDMPTVLQARLRAALTMFNNEQISKSKPIVQPSQFGDWVRTNPIARNVIDRFNAENGLTTPETGTKPESTGGDEKETKIKAAFKGTIIYATVGTDVEGAKAANPDVVDANDLIKQRLIALDKVFENMAVEKAMAQLFKGNSKQALEIYDAVLSDMKRLAGEGKTVITTIGRYAKEADMVFVNTDNKAVIDIVGKDRIDAIRSYELGAKKAKIKTYRLSVPIIDILTGKTKLSSAADAISGRLVEAIENAQSIDELQDIYDAVSDKEVEKAGLTIEGFTELYNKKMQELSSKIPTFEEVSAKDTLMMKDKTKYGPSGIVYVVYKSNSDRTLRVRPISSDETFIISEDEMKNDVQYMYREGADRTANTVTATKSEIDNSNTNLNNTNDEAITKGLKDSIAKAESMTQEEIDNEFDNSLGCE